MAKRRKINMDNHCRYEISVNDWSVSVSFNDYAYFNISEEEFEESIHMILEGSISSTTSKKCSKVSKARLIIYYGDFWYEKDRLKKDLHTIGHMEIQKSDPELDLVKEDILYFWLSIPTKSYENIKDYLIYKSKAQVTILGTELFRRKGDVYYFRFEK